MKFTTDAGEEYEFDAEIVGQRSELLDTVAVPGMSGSSLREVLEERFPLPYYFVGFYKRNEKNALTDKIVGGIKNPAMVLSTVVAMIDEWIQNYQPSLFVIAAKESSRYKLYERMINKMSKYIPYQVVKCQMSSMGNGWMFLRKE